MLEWFLQYVWEISCGVAVSLIAAYVYLCGLKIYKNAEELKRVSNAQDLIAAVKASSMLKPLWTTFEKTLTTVGDKTYSTIDAAEFFNLQSLTRGMSMTFWQNYGGIFTGLGILGTFAGLTFGLSGVDMTSGDIKVLQDGIKKLLSGVESAFVTSLVGIGCALVYNVAHHCLIKKFQSNVQSLADKLDEKFPRRSAEDWLRDINGTTANHFTEAQVQTTVLKIIGEQVANAIYYDEAQEQTETLKTIGDTTANHYAEAQEQTTVLKNIGEQVAEAIHNALDEKLAEYVENICAAIDKLSKGAAKDFNKTILTVAGGQMDRFSAALDKFSDKAETIMANAQEVSRIMNEQLLNTLEKLNDGLRQQADADAAERAAANEKFLSTLESLTVTLDEVADKIKTQQADSVKNFAELLKTSLDNFNATMTQILERAQDKSNVMNQNFFETLKSLTATLDEVAAKIKTNAELANQQANEDRENHKKQTDAANEKFLSTLAALSKTLQDVVDKFNQQQTGTLNDFKSLVAALIDDLDKFNRKQQAFMDKIATSNAAQISEAVKAFSDIVNRHNATTKDMFGKVQKLLDETETYLEFMSDASTALKQAADPVKQSTLQLTKNLTETAAQMNKLADANRLTRENLSDLAAQLHAFVKNFSDIAKELDRSTKIIKDSLENYNYKMSDGLRDALTKFDKSMNDSVGHLQGLVEGLTDALEDLKKIRR